MNTDLERLIPAIVSKVRRSDAYITKTKLLKLLYLFDIEFYRIHRETFTQFNWIYYHLGPWTREYDPLLHRLEEHGVLLPTPSTHPDYDATFYKTPEEVRLFGILPRQDEAILRRVLNTWGDKSTAQILDHVYFRTEPIEQGERDQRLDFSLIPVEAPVKYSRTSSGKTPEQILRMRSEFQARANNLHDELVPVAIPPKYDDAYFEFLEKLENDVLR
jgi:antitoxin SocA-like protein